MRDAGEGECSDIEERQNAEIQMVSEGKKKRQSEIDHD